MARPDHALPGRRSLKEHLVFIALLLPTFIVLAAAVVSLAHPDPSVAIPRPAQTTAACEPCAKYAPEDDPEDER